MMRYIGQAKVVTARKNYGCDACIWITEPGMDTNEWFLEGLSFAEKKVIVKARSNGWRVMKGERCVIQTLVSCDSKIIISWRAIPEIHELNINHGMYIDVETC